MPTPNQVWEGLRNSRVWKSIFRYSYPTDRRNRIMTVAKNVFLHLHPNFVPRGAIRVTYTWCLGGLSFMLFLILTVTGVLLMFYYVPSVTQAYENIKDLETVVTFGMLMRNLHRWGAHGMVITVFLHMCRVFYTGSYKPPREFNWVVGVILFVLTLLLSFTGYLLPWDQLAFWAITVGTSLGGAAPLLGTQVNLLLLGGLRDRAEHPHPLVHPARDRPAPGALPLPGRPLLAGAPGRRDLTAPLRRSGDG